MISENYNIKSNKKYFGIASANLLSDYKMQYRKYPYIIFVIFILGSLFLNFSISNNPKSSLISATIIFFLLTLISSKLILRSNRWVVFFGLIFLLKLILGISHYLIFVDHDYFNGDGALASSFWHEYQSVFNQVADVVKDKISHGSIFYFDKEAFEVTHPEIWNLISIPLVYLGCYALTITPINIFFTSLLSINLVFICKYIFVFTKKKVSAVAWTTSLFPMFLLADNFYRDQIGMGLMSIGITLYLISKNPIQKIISIGLLLYFSYILRTLYPAIFILALILYYIIINRKKRKYLIWFVPIILLIVLYAVNDIVRDNEYISGYITPSGWVYLPVKIVLGVIGPFPWSQFMLYKVDPAISYQLPDYLLGIFQLSYLTLLIQNAKKLFKRENLNILTLFGLGIALSGIVTKQMHIGYIAEGIVLTLPWFFSKISLIDFNKRLIWMSLLLISLNIFVSLVGNLGISTLWR